MSLPGREPAEIEAIATDRYIDELLNGRDSLGDLARDASGIRAAIQPMPSGPHGTVNDAVRAISKRLVADLPRFHPSFRFEEHLALRLAEAAAAMRLSPPRVDAPRITPMPVPPFAVDAAIPARVTADGLPDSGTQPRPHPTALVPDTLDAADARAFLLGGAVAASALSLAGAAWIAWRRRGSASLMTRAARAAHRGRLSEQVRNVTGLHG